MSSSSKDLGISAECADFPKVPKTLLWVTAGQGSQRPRGSLALPDLCGKRRDHLSGLGTSSRGVWERLGAGTQMQKTDPCHRGLESHTSIPMSSHLNGPGQVGGEGAGPGCARRRALSLGSQWVPCQGQPTALGPSGSCSHGLWRLHLRDGSLPSLAARPEVH